MRVRVHIALKPGVLDPQGKAVARMLGDIGFTGVEGVRQGKYLEIDLAETDPEAARCRVEAMCTRLLANPVIEDYTIEIETRATAPRPAPPTP